MGPRSNRYCGLSPTKGVSNAEVVPIVAGVTMLEAPNHDTANLTWVVFDDGSPDELARWDGEGTAHIISVAAPGAHQRVGDEIGVEPLGETDAAGLPLVRHTGTVRRGGFRSFSIVGAHPGAKLWAVLERQMTNRGWVLWTTDEGPDTILTPAGLRLAALRARLAVPEGTSLFEIDAVLGAVTIDWATPPTWLELAIESGGDPSRHRWAAGQ